MNGRTIKYQL